MRWGWLVGAVLLAAAALSVWFAFRSPEFVAGLTAIAAGAAWRALAPKVAQQMPEEEEAEFQREFRAGRGDAFLRRRRGQPPKG
ncbi:MAG: hypothetical protein ABFD96_05905 [Armatimonadia bacterium]